MQVTENTVTGKSPFQHLFCFLCKKKALLFKAQFCPFINHKVARKFSKWINQTLQKSRFRLWQKWFFKWRPCFYAKAEFNSQVWPIPKLFMNQEKTHPHKALLSQTHWVTVRKKAPLILLNIYAMSHWWAAEKITISWVNLLWFYEPKERRDTFCAIF